MQLSMGGKNPASPSTGMGSSARSCARSRLPSSATTVDLTVAASDPGAMNAVGLMVRTLPIDADDARLSWVAPIHQVL